MRTSRFIAVIRLAAFPITIIFEAIGENNKGFLEFRGKKQPQKDVVNAENGDRKKIYQAIGKKQGASATLVGQRRAKAIASKSKAGHWLQKPNGGWYKK